MGVKKQRPGLGRGKWDIFVPFRGNPGCASPGRKLMKYNQYSFYELCYAFFEYANMATFNPYIATECNILRHF
jgi:hypothetical protein